MAFMKMSKDLDIISNMKDRPWEPPNGLSTAEIKAKFDEAGKLLKNFINSFIDDLAKSTAASNIGATVNDGNSRKTTTIQGAIDTLEGYANSAITNSVGTSAIKDAAVTGQKIADDAVTVKKIVDGSVSGDKLATNAVSTTHSGTLSANGWNGTSAPYVQTVTVEGIFANDEPIIDVLLNANNETAMQEDEQWGNIFKATTSIDKITFYAKEKPTVALSFKARCIRK